MPAVKVGRVAVGHRDIRVNLLRRGINGVFLEGDVAQIADSRRCIAAVHLIGDGELSKFGIPDWERRIGTPQADFKLGQAGKTA
ncbi:hypothetical protein Psfp_03454 [Pelotomaculum sp. FP]|nr:hypothetical protein Psfp_03454 [Pelotomaculum sp. FP]